MSVKQQDFDFDRQSQLLADLEHLIAATAAEEARLTLQFAQATEAADASFRRRRQQLSDEYSRKRDDLHEEYENDREGTIFDYESDCYDLVQSHDRQLHRFGEERQLALHEADRRLKLALKATEETHAASKSRTKQQLAATARECDERRRAITQLEAQTRDLLRRRRCRIVEEDSPDAAPSPASFDESFREMQSLSFQLQSHAPARFLEQHWPLLIFVLTWFAAAYPVALVARFNPLIWPVATTVVALVVALAVRAGVRPFMQRRARELFPRIRANLRHGLADLEAAQQMATAERVTRDNDADRHRDDSIRGATLLHADKQTEIEQNSRRQVEQENASFEARNAEFRQIRDRRLHENDAWLPANLNPLTIDFDAKQQQLDQQHQQQRLELKQQFDREWAALANRWTSGVARFQVAVDAATEFCKTRFQTWDDSYWQSWQSPEIEPPILPFGRHHYCVEAIDKVNPRNEQFSLPRRSFDLPAALQLPNRPSLLYEADGSGRERAVQSMRNVMLRMLTSLPAGKVRFTIIDPVGLGQNFSAFMHLADFDEKLVASRIWTETSHIQKRLTDLTEHMENVIQKYLRNEFESIHDYNQHAGEVAEPFQILVVANFPAAFSDEAARRLTSIASSGARCGVYTLISVDTKMNLPRNFELADLERDAITLRWSGDQFSAVHPRMQTLPLTLDAPPEETRFTEIVRIVGREAKDASRVEVPFASVTAPAQDWWSGDSRSGIEVALGRAGATKLQQMRLGSGTSQHVLISGKTGSGKSTLLNALIVNLAIWYSPEEIQFYLVDFKKGVEFKPYATHQLPHARVIAVESEREFGMSVLERLDAELRERGDLFRKQGVQNLCGWRDANPDAIMPRLLLIIDEFQEFFVKEDKIAADAALLLDRLVRQGRAFGIHVLLGSQTLAGAYSLARSTLGQMAVRIALQCSEADAHLILSDENTAARLLSRPGEAIYNDANGLIEGNHPFQVVWLSDGDREHYLHRIRELAKVRAPRVSHPIVFEGNQPADPSENTLFVELLEQGPCEDAFAAPCAWLGSAVAIKDPTSVAFRRQSGANLLVVGPQEELAVGLLMNSVTALAASRLSNGNSHANGEPAFLILDGLRLESPVAGCWRKLAERMPQLVQAASGRDALSHLAALYDEVNRRIEAADESAPPRFLVIANLARFRELQKGDDFGFSSFGEEEKPDSGKQFRGILRDGPGVGVHTLIWADSFSSASRWLDRQAMQDLDFRVLFQMGASDSSNLMDSTAAANLGPYRALLYRHELGEFEKFRPYAFPTVDWLDRVAEALRQRVALRG